MPNPWTGKGTPYTREEVRERLQATIAQKKAIIVAEPVLSKVYEIVGFSGNNIPKK